LKTFCIFITNNNFLFFEILGMKGIDTRVNVKWACGQTSSMTIINDGTN
jgi:hypothetical protein